MIKYSIKYDEEFVIESLEQFRAVKYRQLSRVFIKSIGLVGLIALFAFCIYIKFYSIAAIFAFFIALLLAGPRFDYWLMKRRLRKSPFYNQMMQIEVSTEGVVIKSDISEVKLSWQVFTQYVSNKKGFLLQSGKSDDFWWPNASITEGTLLEVEALIKQYVGT